MNRICLWLLGSILLCGDVLADWPQWGGPERDFHVSDVKLADEWPEGNAAITFTGVGILRLWSCVDWRATFFVAASAMMCGLQVNQARTIVAPRRPLRWRPAPCDVGLRRIFAAKCGPLSSVRCI